MSHFFLYSFDLLQLLTSHVHFLHPLNQLIRHLHIPIAAAPLPVLLRNFANFFSPFPFDKKKAVLSWKGKLRSETAI